MVGGQFFIRCGLHHLVQSPVIDVSIFWVILECNLYQLMKDREKMFSEGEQMEIYTMVYSDFGLAREISSQPPYTEYVSTRW
ncbi:hypothetical protein AHAS_Ahas19G0180300 [Arachis hypogaea]